MKYTMTLYLLVFFIFCQPVLAESTDRQTLPHVEHSFTAPEFSLESDDRKHYRLADFRGKVVMINFWATWCPPCRREMPSMERMWQKIKGKGIQVFAINVGEDADTIFEFRGSYPVTFPILMDKTGAIVKKYPVTGLPTTYIINPQGKVVYRAVGSREWDKPALFKQLLELRKQK